MRSEATCDMCEESREAPVSREQRRLSSKYVRDFLIAEKRSVANFVVAAVLTALSEAGLAFVLMILASLAMSGDGNILIASVGAILYLAPCFLVDVWVQYAVGVLTHKFAFRLRSDCIEAVRKANRSERDEILAGEFSARVINDADALGEELMQAGLRITRQVILLIVGLASTALINPWFVPLAIVVSCLAAFVPKMLGNWISSTQSAWAQERRELLESVGEFTRAGYLISNFGWLPAIRHRMESSSERLRVASNRKHLVHSVTQSATWSLGTVIIFAAWGVGAWLATMGAISLPEVIALAQLMTLVAGPFQAIGDGYAEFLGGFSLLDRIVTLFRRARVAEKATNADGPDRIELRDVELFRDGGMIVSCEDLVLSSGDRVLVCGASGSGKSSLLGLIYGRLEPSNGSVRFLRGSAEASHSDATIIPQASLVLASDLTENVTLSEEMPTDQLSSVVETLGLGGIAPDRRLSPNSVSGGESRRIDLARILMRTKKIVLLDEPFAGLDRFSADTVAEQIKSLDCDVLIVASHDLPVGLATHFNRVLTVADGKVSETTSTPEWVSV